MPELTSTKPAPAQIVMAASRVAWADMKVLYTPVTWTLGWLGRIIVQVLFFAVIGILLQDPDAIRYLFIGQAVMACAVEAFMCIASTTWERNAGTLALLTSSPGPLWPVFVGRSLQWVPSGIATSSVTLFGIGPLLGVEWTPAGALAAFGCVVIVSAGSYALALVAAAIVLRGPRWRNVVSNVSHTSIMLIAGVTVPTGFWPGWCQSIAAALPLTHGLEAVRMLSESVAIEWVDVGLRAAAAAGLAALWLVVAAAAFSAFGQAGRRDGSIDFGE